MGHWHRTFVAVLIGAACCAQNPIEMSETFTDSDQANAMVLDMEQWAQWIREPLNINLATVEELLQLPGVDEIKAHQLLEYRFRVRSIRSPFELLPLRSWTIVDIERIVPYISFDDFNLKNSGLFFGKPRHEILLRSKTDRTPSEEVQEGVSTGNNNYGYIRYVGTYGSGLQWGLAMEKDHGEAIEYKDRILLHRCGFVQFKTGWKPIEEFTVGSFRLSWGQGLIVRDGYRGGDGPQLRTSSTARVAGHASSAESGFQNGIIARGNASIVHYGLWVGATAQSIKVDSLNGIWSIAYTDGSYRDPKRASWYRSSQQKRIGGYVFINFRGFNLGGLYESRTWTTDEYAEFVQPLRKMVHSGIVRWRGNRLQCSGEAFLSGGRKGYELQSVWVPDDQWKLRVRLREVETFVQGDLPRFYFDIRPQGEREFTAEQWWNIFPKANLYVFYRKRLTDSRLGLRFNYGRVQDIAVQIDGQFDSSESRKQGRIQMRKQWKKWQVTLRSQWNESEAGNGALWYADVQYKLGSSVKIYARWTDYHTTDFDHRLYTYENDLLYSFSVPAHYGRGKKIYLMVVAKLQNHQCWFKLSYDRELELKMQYRITI